MDWKRQDKYHFESDNHRYRVSLAFVHGRCVYTAWRRVSRVGEPIWVGHALLYTDSLEQAKAACEEDANVNQT